MDEYCKAYIDGQILHVKDLILAETELRRARREDDKEAISKAERSVDERLHAMNNLRAEMTTQVQTFATKEAMRIEIKQLESTMERNKEDINGLGSKMIPRSEHEAFLREWRTWRASIDNWHAEQMGRGAGMTSTVKILMGVVTAVAVIIGIVSTVIALKASPHVVNNNVPTRTVTVLTPPGG